MAPRKPGSIVPGYGLVWFMGVMQRKLEDNSHKTGWRYLSEKRVLLRIKQEMTELRKAIVDPKSTAEDIAAECADVANFLMMLADNARGTRKKKTTKVTLTFTQKQLEQLGMVKCTCGHPPNNHFNDQAGKPCAHCECKRYKQRIMVAGKQIKEIEDE